MELINKPSITRTDALAIAIVAIASIIGINQYIYGLYNHFITIPFLKSIINPELYPTDYLIVEKQYLYTYFLSLFSWLIKTTHLSIPVIYFLFYSLSLYATFIAFFRLALDLFNEKIVAWFSLLLLVFSFTTLGEVRTIESLFLERSFTLPMLLFAIHLYLRERYFITFALLGVGFLFHPLSAVYVIGFLVLCSVFSFKKIGIVTVTLHVITLAIIISPSLYLKFTNPAPSLGFLIPDPNWVGLLRLRSTHHLFPFSWDLKLFLKAGLFIIGFFITWKYKSKTQFHNLTKVLTTYILILCILGTILTEIYPTTIIIQFQLFRSFKFLIYFALIYYANYFVTSANNKSPIWENVLVTLLFAFIFYNHNLPKFASFLIVLLSIFPLYGIVLKMKPAFQKYYLPAQLSLLLLLGIVGSVARGNFTIHNAQNQNWLDVQQWAKDNTDISSLFVVPPNKLGFRVEAERTIYGDWKDGTQMFFNPLFGFEWIRRMKKLGYVDDNRLQQTYMNLTENDFKKIHLELLDTDKPTYVVMPIERVDLGFSSSYANKDYKVYKIE